MTLVKLAEGLLMVKNPMQLGKQYKSLDMHAVRYQEDN